MDVWSARTPDGGQRFYPPGAHPASRDLYEMQRRLEAFPTSPPRDEMLEYVKQQILCFEAGESDAKARYAML